MTVVLPSLFCKIFVEKCIPLYTVAKQTGGWRKFPKFYK